MKHLKQQSLILLIGSLFSFHVQSATVGFSADTTTKTIGETFDISIIAKNFTELSGGIINFRIDSPSSISVKDVMVDSHWDIKPEKGELVGDTWKGIGFDVFNNDPLNGDGLIAKVSLTAEQPGTTTLTLLDSSEFFSTTEQLVTSEIINNTNFEITVQAVPLPASVWLMGSSLIGLIGLKKKTHSLT